MSGQQLQQEMLVQCVQNMLRSSRGPKKRRFTETVEIHFGLKNFDPARDKRISGYTELPHAPRKKFSCLVLGNEKHLDEAKALGLDYRSLDDLSKINRNKKIVKKMGKSYDKLLASSNIIRQIPRLLGPTLNRIGKFPTAVRPNETIAGKIDGMSRTIRFQLKFKIGLPMCLSAPVGHIDMTEAEVIANITASVNYVLTLMKKGWLNIKKIHIKSTMGPPFTIYGF